MEERDVPVIDLPKTGSFNAHKVFPQDLQSCMRNVFQAFVNPLGILYLSRTYVSASDVKNLLRNHKNQNNILYIKKRT